VKDDVTSRLDALRTAVDEARSVPMSASVMINRSDFHAMLDDLERVIDKTLSEATEVVGDRDAVVALGSEEAEEILRQARLQSEQMVSDTDVYRLATERAVEVQQAAAREAASLRAETDAYVEAKLANFELTLERTLDLVQKGRAQLSGGHSHRLGDDSDVQDIVLSEHFDG
jgi:cell division septum initiation protein DivIVA